MSKQTTNNNEDLKLILNAINSLNERIEKLESANTTTDNNNDIIKVLTAIANAKASTSTNNVKVVKKSKKAQQSGEPVKGMKGCFSYKDKEWTWIGGETKAHKDKLMKQGYHFSGRRQQWYKIG